MKQSASNQQPEDKRAASELLRLVAVLLVVVALLGGGAAYQFKLTAGVPVAICCTAAAVIAFLLSARASRREAARERLAAFLASELGQDWDASTLRTAKFKEGVPRRIDFAYQPRQPDHDPEWRGHLVEVVRRRIGVDEIKAKWSTGKNRVRMLGLVTIITALDRSRVEVTERVRRILQPLFRNVELKVNVPVWGEDEGDEKLLPRRIELAYGVTSVDGSELWVKRVEAMAGLKLGGRWRASFDPTKDQGYLEPRPTLPTNIAHPGVSLYDGSDPAQPAPPKHSPVLYYGHDENGVARGWPIGKKSTMPHGLYIGPTGSGKTTVLRSLTLGALAQRIPVFAADPKMIELTPFYGFPGCYIASTPAEIAKMIDTMESLMYERYDAIKRNPAVADTLTPVLFILDELLIARQVLKRFHASQKGRGTPPWFDSIAALAALARSAQIHVAIGVQRPDASLFDDGARDNFRQRCSLMRLSPQGSEMLWGTRYVGVDLPMVQGRAMASPDGENPIEMQTFWVADPITAKGKDRETIEAFRELAERNFADYEMPVDVSPFENDPPKIDVDALPKGPEDIELGVADEVEEREGGVGDLDTQDVKAEQITEGDEIVLEEGGEPVSVVGVDEDPFDDESVQLTVSTAAGEELHSLPRDHFIARVLFAGAE